LQPGLIEPGGITPVASERFVEQRSSSRSRSVAAFTAHCLGQYGPAATTSRPNSTLYGPAAKVAIYGAAS